MSFFGARVIPSDGSLSELVLLLAYKGQPDFLALLTWQDPIKTSRVDGSGCAVTDSMTATHPVGPEVLPERVWAGQLADDADHDMPDTSELAVQQQPPLGSSIEPAG